MRHALAVAGHKVVFDRQSRHLAHCHVQPAHHGRKLVAVRAGNAKQHIYAWALKSTCGQGVDTHHAPSIIPTRLHAQGIKGLAFHHPLVAHGLASPQGEGNFFGPLALVLFAVLLHPGFKRGHANVPRLTGGHTAGVKAIQIAPSRQTLGVAHRVATIAGSQVLAVKRGQKADDLFVMGKCGIELLGPQGQCQQYFGLQHLALSPVGHRAGCQMRCLSLYVLCAQVELAGSVGIG